jgi:hypothetical protein
MARVSENIYSKLSLKYGLHLNVIHMICNHPYIFASRRMADPDDEKDLMFIYIGKIRLKRRLLGKKRAVYDNNQANKNINKESE